ncbi:MAG TPA: hypothetical protein VN982_04990 [Candidatus Dormibacteraeota bacterium]|nr:hypothetical protein [Candidatus Dormibacteraeota bacterium]
MRCPLLVGFLLLPSMLSAQHRAADEVALAPRPGRAPVAATPVHPGAISAPAPRPTPAPIAPIAVRPAAVPRPLPNRVAPLRPQPSRPPAGAPRQAIPSSSQIASSPSLSDGSNSFDGSADLAVPGLGFDYVHFAATHPQQAHRRNPGNPENGAVIPIFGSGYYPSYSPVVDEPAAQPPVEQPGEPQYDQPPPLRRQPSTQLAEVPAPPVEHLPAPYPLAESDEYVFVRRDGTVFFAVAYAWDLKTLRYITRQGLRKSISSDSLDLDATHQFNEQRGLTFRMPT